MRFSTNVWKQSCSPSSLSGLHFCDFPSLPFPTLLLLLGPLLLGRLLYFCASIYLCPPPLPSSSCLPTSNASSDCQPTAEPRERDLQESKMAGHGRSFQWHNTQRTLFAHAKINLTSIHHLTLFVQGFGEAFSVQAACLKVSMLNINIIFTTPPPLVPLILNFNLNPHYFSPFWCSMSD